MKVALLLLFTCIAYQALAQEALPPTADKANTAPSKSVDVALSQAQTALDAHNYKEAEQVLLRALESPSLTKGDREALQASLEPTRLPQRQLVQLSEIEHMIRVGDTGEARTKLLELLPPAADDRVRERIRTLLASIPAWSPVVGTLKTWIVFLIPIAFALILVWALRRSLSALLKGRQRRWLLSDVVDKSERNSQQVIARHFSQWASQEPSSVTSGLLLMEATSIPLSPHFDLGSEPYDVSQALSTADLAIGGVSIAGLARSMSALYKWLVPQPRKIHGFAYIDDKQRVCARLTAELPKAHAATAGDRVLTVSAVANGNDEESVDQVAKEVTFKMLYAIAKEDAVPAEYAYDMVRGLEHLRAYLSANVSDSSDSLLDRLEQARNLFERVRKSRPELLEAHIYEGIALDLLERHDDAAAHFEYVKHLTENTTGAQQVALHERATYNEAVAHLRNLYALKEIDRAKGLLERLIGTSPKLEERPLLTLASATLADAWANRTIHWKKIARSPAEAPEDQHLLAVIEAHKREVIRLTAQVRSTLDRIKKAISEGGEGAKAAIAAGWTRDTLRQVEWAVHNALGDFYLYAAVALTRLDVEKSAVFKKIGNMRLSAEFRECVEKAISELRTCEMLLPAGVETLSNLGTLFLVRADSGDLPIARAYLMRAIRVNSHYEYAYYRLAQSWQNDFWREKVIEVLRSFPIPPQIPEFAALFRDYFVEPKFN